MNKKKRIKKEATALVYKKIETALAEVKGKVKEKKFTKKLKKASKILAADIANAAGKDLKAVKKARGAKGTSKKSGSRKLKKPVKNAEARMNDLALAPQQQPAPDNAQP